MQTLSPLLSNDRVTLYRLDGAGAVDALVATTPGTRRICNDPLCAGIAYTRALQSACTDILAALGADRLGLRESETVVVNILRGGLNFGLRDALADAYGWNHHTTSFISAQRARSEQDPDEWHITENAYKKVYFPPAASFVVGDVVATGTSLRYGLEELVRIAKEQSVDLRSIVFFTYGGPRAREILEEIDADCRRRFPSYQRTTLIFLEGCFAMAEASTPLHIRIPGTDLLRLGAAMAPEFVESQYEGPSYPIERCTIYDAGSRAFWIREYAADVIGYWRENLQMAERGMTYRDLLAERFPSLDPDRFGSVDLIELCKNRIRSMEELLKAKD